MKKILLILFIFCAFTSKAQTYFANGSPTVTNYYYNLAARNTLKIPIGCDTTTALRGLDSLGLMYLDSCANIMYIRGTSSGGTHKWIAISYSSQNYWTLNGTDLYPNITTYDVGIGTTNPSHKFEVVSGTSSLFFNNGILDFYDNTTNRNHFIGQNAGLAANGSNNIALGDFAVEYVTGSNNIGIGAQSVNLFTGSNNVGVGTNASPFSDFDDNTAVGFSANYNAYGQQNIAIGSGANTATTLLSTSSISNSTIVTSSATISGAAIATFITTASLSISSTYVFKLNFAGTQPSPYTNTTLTFKGVVTNSNTITFQNISNFTSQGSGTYTLTVFTKENNSIAIGYGATAISNQIVLGNSSSTSLVANQIVLDLSTVPTTGYVLTWDGSKYSPAAGGASSLTFTPPLVNTAGVVTINNAAADASTKGASTYNASDFNSSSGLISIDYTNGQAASTSLKGFLSATDWNTFNSKASAATGAITTFYSSNATASRAIVSDGSGKLAVSATTSTEIGYVNGVTSAIQTQLNAKLGTSLTSGQILVGNGSNVAAGVTMSGDATISNAGVLTLKNSGVVAGTYGSANITVDAQGRVTAAADGTGGGGAGTVTSVLGTSPIVSDGNLVTPTISILNAKADGSTKGAAWFSAADFNDNGSGGISIDYTNGQAASGSLKGFLTSADWTTFNNKVSTTRTITAGTGLTGGGDLSADRTITLNSIAGFIAAGTNISITGTGSISSPYTISSTGGGGSGTVTNFIFTNGGGFTGTVGTSTTTPTLSLVLQNAAADGTTKGQATFTAADFNATTGLISLDYTNMQIVTGSVNGIVTPTLYNTWNAKQDAITGAITTVTSSNLTSSRAVISNALGKIDVSTTTSTDLTNFVLAHTQQTLTDGATITMNCANGYLGKVTLGGNRTLAITNNTNGYDIVIEVIQDGTGNRTLTLPSGSIVPVGFGSGTSITLSTTGGAKDIIYGKYDGTNYFWTIAKQFQ